MLIDISNQFEISLDTLIKEDSKMVKTIDKERVLGKIKKEKSIIEFFTGAGTGIIVACLLSPDFDIMVSYMYERKSYTLPHLCV